MTSQNKNLRLVFIAAIFFVFILSFFSYTKINSLIESAAWVNHTTQVTLGLEKVIGSLKDAETAHRGYLLTHEKTFLESFSKALKEYPQNIKTVKQIIQDNIEQQKIIARIELLAQHREDYLLKMLDIDKLRTPTAAELLIGKSIMDSLRNEVNSMISVQNSLMEQRSEELHKQTIIAPATLFSLSIIALVILFVSYWQLNKSLLQAQQLKAEQIKQAVQLEKTKEIKDSEKRFNLMLMKSPFCFAVVKGADMVIVLANTAVKELWAKGNDIEGKRLLEILPELEGTGFPEILQNVISTGIPYYGYDTLAQLNRNGETDDYYFNFVYQPYYEADETISGVTIIAIEVTKEVRAKKHLEEADNRFRSMVNQAPVAICVLRNINFVVEVANEKQLQLWGKTREDVLNIPVFEAVPEAAGQGFEELLSGVIKNGEPFIANESPVTLPRNGKNEITYVNFVYEPLYDNEHKIDGVLAVTIDVSEQVLARKKVEESEKRYNLMLMQSPFAFLILKGNDMVVHLANESMKEVLGKGPDIEGKPLLEVLPEIKGQAFPDLLNNVYNTGIPFSANEMLAQLARNGKLENVYFNYVYQPYYEADNTISGVTVIAYDVTSTVIANKQIEESEERFRSLAQTLPQLVWVTDAQGNAEFASCRWKEYTGIEPGGEREWKAVVHPDDYDNINNAWLHSLKTGNIYASEVRLKSKDGEYKWHAVKGEPVLDRENKIIKWVGAFTDIQSRKLQEEKKDEFISIASHELKTPLTTAKAYLQMLELLLDEKNDEANLYAKKAIQSIGRLNELIRELLDVSKIRLGKLDYTITSFNFNEMIESTVENLQLTSPTHAIIKTGKVHDEVTGDKDRLQQVIINLLNNAIKYSPGVEKVYITIAQENNMVKVSVKDTGIGIAKHSLQKIFDKYHRVEEHAEHFQGLGIGLFISHEIIQRHQGELWAESEISKGSTFYFTIPLDRNLQISKINNAES